MTSVNAGGTPRLTAAISLAVIVLPRDAAGLAVGGDHPLVDAPGRHDLAVGVGREQGRAARGICQGV